MKSSSDTYPESTVQSAGKTQVRYNIIETPRTEMDGTTRIAYDYDYVEIEGEVTRAKIINAIIASSYPKDAEIAMINNELASPGTAEYAEYQALRTQAKEIADEVLG